MRNFTSGLVVYRSDFRRPVTWRTLVHCWLMWSGSDLAGHICETNDWLWALEASLPLKLDSERNWCANRAPTDVCIVGCEDVCASIRLTVLPCPCSGLRPKKSSQRLGGLKSLRIHTTYESQLTRLLQRLQNGSSSLMLQRRVMFSPHFFSHTIFACCN